MESVVLVTDRAELREVMRRAMRLGPVFRVITPAEWRRGEFGTTRDRLFILDLPSPSGVRERMHVAENWPHGFAGSLLVVLGESVVPAFPPSPVVDGILVEPFSDAEATLRIRHIIWKARMASSPEVLTFGEMSIDSATYEVSIGGRSLNLTYKEYELLRFLASNPGRVFTRDMLLSRVWGEDYYGGTRTVDVHVRRLRVKLGPDHEAYVGTVRNVGYRFQVPEPDEPPEP